MSWLFIADFPQLFLAYGYCWWFVCLRCYYNVSMCCWFFFWNYFLLLVLLAIFAVYVVITMYLCSADFSSLFCWRYLHLLVMLTNALFWIIFCCDYCWRSLLLFLLLQLLLIMERGYFSFLPNCLFFNYYVIVVEFCWCCSF